MACVIFETNGTDGDVLPFIRIGSQLVKLGHKVAMVTHSYYEALIGQANIDFIPLDTPADYAQFINDNATMCTNPQGYIAFLRRNELPRILPAYHRIKDYYIPNQTVIIGKSPGMLSTIVAEKLNIPRIVVYLAPAFVMSEEFSDMIYDLLKEDIAEIRNQLGIHGSYHSDNFWRNAQRYVGLWPEWFKAEHSYSNKEIEKIGFVVDTNQTGKLPDEVMELLNGEDKPILINSSSSCLFMNSDFFESTVKACGVLGQKAIFVVRYKDFIPENLPKEIHVFTQLQFSILMPKVKAIIHHGGIGTSAQALASGIPQLVLAGGVDRPDNGMCLKKLGVGEYLLPTYWKYENVMEALQRVSTSREIRENCKKMAEVMKNEKPVEAFNEIIISVLKHYPLGMKEDKSYSDEDSSNESQPNAGDMKEEAASQTYISNEFDKLTQNMSQKELELLLSLIACAAENNESAIKKQPRKTDINSFPISFNQEEFWLLNKAQKDFLGLNLSSAYKISGPLNTEALEKAFNEIIKRHENLHTIFKEEDGRVIQYILPVEYIPLPMMDLQELENEKQEIEVKRILYQKIHEPFDLSNGPLIRFLLMRLDKEEYVIWWGLHHILVDGWGQAVLMKEIKELYSWFAFHKMHSLPEIEIHCADYSVWQRDYLNPDKLKEKEIYWENKLAGYNPRLTLPSDFERPEILNMNNGDDELFYISRELEDKLKGSSCEAGTTLFMSLLSAINLLIYIFTEETDIAIGSPISSRNREELEDLICDFTNTLVYRTVFRKEDTIYDVIKKVKETALDLYQNQELPSQDINRILDQKVDPGYSPLFQIFYVLHEIFPGDGEQFLEGLNTRYLNIEKKLSQFDVSFYLFINKQDGLYGKLEYNKDLYLHETILKFIHFFKEILKNMVENPDLKISELKSKIELTISTI